MKNTIAVLLSGCGHLDGAEINESVLSLLALSERQVPYQVFSLNKMQELVVNHLTLKIEESANRNIMVESARIARGEIKDISELRASDYTALIMPGGFGVARNFSDLAIKDEEFEVKEEIAQVIMSFFEVKKPIGGICISPAIIAKVLSRYSNNLLVTLGDEHSILKNIKGVKQEVCKADEVIIDFNNKIVTTPAFMIEGVSLALVYKGISKMMDSLLELI